MSERINKPEAPLPSLDQLVEAGYQRFLSEEIHETELFDPGHNTVFISVYNVIKEGTWDQVALAPKLIKESGLSLEQLKKGWFSIDGFGDDNWDEIFSCISHGIICLEIKSRYPQTVDIENRREREFLTPEK